MGYSLFISLTAWISYTLIFMQRKCEIHSDLYNLIHARLVGNNDTYQNTQWTPEIKLIRRLHPKVLSCVLAKVLLVQRMTFYWLNPWKDISTEVALRSPTLAREMKSFLLAQLVICQINQKLSSIIPDDFRNQNNNLLNQLLLFYWTLLLLNETCKNLFHTNENQRVTNDR